MFRVGAFDPLELYPDVNADDAQIAILTRMGAVGRFRTLVWSSTIRFQELQRASGGRR